MLPSLVLLLLLPLAGLGALTNEHCALEYEMAQRVACLQLVSLLRLPQGRLWARPDSAGNLLLVYTLPRHGGPIQFKGVHRGTSIEQLLEPDAVEVDERQVDEQQVDERPVVERHVAEQWQDKDETTAPRRLLISASTVPPRHIVDATTTTRSGGETRRQHAGRVAPPSSFSSSSSSSRSSSPVAPPLTAGASRSRVLWMQQQRLAIAKQIEDALLQQQQHTPAPIRPRHTPAALSVPKRAVHKLVGRTSGRTPPLPRLSSATAAPSPWRLTALRLPALIQSLQLAQDHQSRISTTTTTTTPPPPPPRQWHQNNKHDDRSASLFVDHVHETSSLEDNEGVFLAPSELFVGSA